MLAGWSTFRDLIVTVFTLRFSHPGFFCSRRLNTQDWQRQDFYTAVRESDPKKSERHWSTIQPDIIWALWQGCCPAGRSLIGWLGWQALKWRSSFKFMSGLSLEKQSMLGLARPPAKALSAVPGLGLRRTEWWSSYYSETLKHKFCWYDGLAQCLGWWCNRWIQKAKPFSCNSISYLTQLKCPQIQKSVLISPKQPWSLPLYFEIFAFVSLVCGMSAEDRDQASLTSVCPMLDGADQQLLSWIQLERTWRTEKSSPCLSSHSLPCERAFGSERTQCRLQQQGWIQRLLYTKSSKPDKYHVMIINIGRI